ncbi:MAG TPA: hypothetical protein DIW51_05110 [Rhodospirillaceae bacterium]|nr:hypothetical protein [Rhodospirillaceae bacterium]HCS69331.1 hypothetical protein [Rhodospirillaceae bacterium]
MGAGSIDEKGGAARLKGDGAAEIADCRVEPALTIEDDAPVVDGGGVPRGERHGPAIVGGGGVERPLAGMGVAPVLEGLGQGAGIPQAAFDQGRAGVEAALGIRIAGAARPALGGPIPGFLGHGRARRQGQDGAEQPGDQGRSSLLRLRMIFKNI